MSDEGELSNARELIDRLERRVEREREARRQSEEVADRSLRRLYSRQRALDLLTRSAAVSNAATDDRQAFAQVIQMIADEYEWAVGHMLVPARDDAQTLVSSGIWVGKEGDSFFEGVKQATVAARFGPGIGVPGRVMVFGPALGDRARRPDRRTQTAVVAGHRLRLRGHGRERPCGCDGVPQPAAQAA
jgi:hypothetical protein